jgi:hypothetical protein
VDRVRELRTKAYERFGVYRARQYLLKRNVTLPTDQIVSIGHFLESGLGRVDETWFERNRPTEFTSQLTELFEMTLADFDPSNHLRPLKALAASVEPYVAWNVFRDFAELLHMAEADTYDRVGRRLRDPFSVGPAEIDLLRSDFMRKTLPSAVRAFDLVRGHGSEGAWLETVFYRFALKVLLADRAAEKQLKEMQRQRVEETLEECLDSQTEAHLLAVLPQALQFLPAAERRAIELYFGISGGREHTVAEVATKLGCSLYHAKATVVIGLARLAGQLGIHGQLEDEEFRFIRFFLVEGYDLESAARQLGWSAAQAYRVLRDVRIKFARVLRARTVSARATRTTDPYEEKGKQMSEAYFSGEDEQFILETVANLRTPPTIHKGGEDDTDDDQVLLNDQWLPLGRVRETLLNNENMMEQLFNQGVPLEWLEYPQGRVGLTELPPDQAQVDDTLHELAQRTFNIAQSLAVRVYGQAVALPPAELTEGILRTLGGVAQSIRSVMPRPLRRKGEAILVIEDSWQGPEGYWAWETNRERLNLRALFVNEGQLVGNLNDTVSANLAIQVWEDLVQGENVLPGFSVYDHESGTVRLLWQRAVI